MKITKTRLKEIIKEELEHAISEQRPPLPPRRSNAAKPAKRPPLPPRRSNAAKPAKRPPAPPKKGGSAEAEQAKTYNRFNKLLTKRLETGLGPEASERDMAEAAVYFLNKAGANLKKGGREPQKQISQYLDGLEQREATKVLRSAFLSASKGMEEYKQQRGARKQKVQQTRSPAGAQ